jgi:uncharacterized protein YjiS (DUF1127 family)
MNRPGQSIALLTPPRLVPSVWDLFRTRLNAWVASWRDQRARRRRIHAFDGIADMNEHLLKDIGAPSSLISRATVRTEVQHRTHFEMGV